MIEIFYKENGQMMVSRSETDFGKIRCEDVVWIDLFSPSGDEKRAVEAFLGTTIQSRAQAEEIESSSRFSETDQAIFANTSFLSRVLRSIPWRRFLSYSQGRCSLL